jgi:septum formation protein
MQELILGSASKWRQKVLSDAGYAFTAMSADIDEKAIRRRDPAALAMTIAQAKATALVQRLEGRVSADVDPLLITSDQVIQVIDGGVSRTYEKPESPEEARAMLRSYGRIGQCATITAVVVTRVMTNERTVGMDCVTITFNPIPEDRIAAAVARGVVMGSCGAFVHEDPDIAPFIKKMYGPKDSVDGMPLFLLERLLAPFQE